jgi:tetratricopeptide (TPR) repeat protein
MRITRIAGAVGVLCALGNPAAAQTAATANPASWRGDLALIAKELPAKHPDAFYRMSRSSWDSAVKSLDAKLPSLNRSQAIVALMQLVAMVKDGHTTINPLFDPAMRVRYYPVELQLFDDGLFVKSASPAHAALAGSKVLRIGNTSAADALALAASTIGYENDWWARAWAPGRLEMVEILEGLGIVRDGTSLSLEVEKDGTRQTVTLAPAGTITPAGHAGAPAIDRNGWTDMRAVTAAPLWQKRPGYPYWSEYQPQDKALYVAYRAVVNMDHPTNEQFWAGVFAQVDSLQPARVILDIRENSGGNSFYNRQVVRGIIARPAIDRRDRLFVITGPRTFSAAMNLALDLERWTSATFVGEPTGNATVFYGDHTQVRLPASGITLNVSTLPWYPDDPRDRRNFIAPRMYAPMTSSDYKAGIDPAMRVIAAAGGGPDMAAEIEAALGRGDSAAAMAVIARSRDAVVNRFNTPEAQINSLGYRLLDSDRKKAIAVFTLNTRAFPASANAWDSLGEALLADGQRDAGIAAYRKALEINPGFASATEALRRLGVAG